MSRSWISRLPARLRARPSRAVVHRCAWLSVVTNIGIVITGSVVRLTGSGLGCPTWPRCHPDSLVPLGALGPHEYIEFGNRLLTYVVGVAAVVSAVTAWRYRPVRRDWRLLSALVLLGIPAQGVIGGLSVLTDLNPWVVMLHMQVSMVLISLACVLLVRSGPLSFRGQASRNDDLGATASSHTNSSRVSFAHPWVAGLGMVLLAVLALVVYLGTMVTGAGPHAGDELAPRLEFDVALLSYLHAGAVMLLVGLSVGMRGLVSVVKAPVRVRSAFTWVLVVQIMQALVGYIQHLWGLPLLLVGVHVALAALLVALSWAAVAGLWYHR